MKKNIQTFQRLLQMSVTSSLLQYFLLFIYVLSFLYLLYLLLFSFPLSTTILFMLMGEQNDILKEYIRTPHLVTRCSRGEICKVFAVTQAAASMWRRRDIFSRRCLAPEDVLARVGRARRLVARLGRLTCPYSVPPARLAHDFSYGPQHTSHGPHCTPENSV